LVLTRVLAALSAASTLEDELESELELVLTAVRAASTLEDELLRLKLDARFVETEAFTALRAASTLDDEFERLREEV